MNTTLVNVTFCKRALVMSFTVLRSRSSITQRCRAVIQCPNALYDANLQQAARRACGLSRFTCSAAPLNTQSEREERAKVTLLSTQFVKSLPSSSSAFAV